jgi:outer membrane lipoprotein-sorting protein
VDVHQEYAAMKKPSILYGLALAFGAVCAALAPGAARAALSKAELSTLLSTLDERQRSDGDWQSNTYVEQHESGKATNVYDAVVMRRSKDKRFVMLFTKPKTSAGQGYLRVDDNLWFYDPSVGRWDRKTERERIGGTSSRRADFDESRLSQEYDPEDSGTEQIGSIKTQVLTLHAKPGLDLPSPVMRLWVDTINNNPVKRQELALSGKLLRTIYYAKWKKEYSPSKKGDTWYASEIRIYDEVEKQNTTLILVDNVVLTPLPDNLFTKAWLESKSR